MSRGLNTLLIMTSGKCSGRTGWDKSLRGCDRYSLYCPLPSPRKTLIISGMQHSGIGGGGFMLIRDSNGDYESMGM